jgi:uncharacterized membrane protein
MRHRMAAGTLALVGLLISAYLTMSHYGLTGPLVCGGSGSCEKVQASRYAVFLGVPVAAIGLGGYVVLLAVALAGTHERFAARSGPTRLLVMFSGLGVAFSAYLTWLELFRIHAVCRWCVASAAVIAGIFVVSLVGMRGVRGEK